MPLNGTGQLLNQDGTTLGMHWRTKTGMKRQMHVSVALISISHEKKKLSLLAAGWLCATFEQLNT